MSETGDTLTPKERIRLKTRTLVATLAALRVIPAAGVASSQTTDVQPEAILVKNIISEVCILPAAGPLFTVISRSWSDFSSYRQRSHMV